MGRSLTDVSQKLRNNLTEAEKYLWYELRMKNLGVKFRRQGVIGKYIVDFVCYEKKLIIEVDGGQHALSQQDCQRNAWLCKQGFRMLRFWNNEVLMNRQEVLEKIVKQLSPPP